MKLNYNIVLIIVTFAFIIKVNVVTAGKCSQQWECNGSPYSTCKFNSKIFIDPIDKNSRIDLDKKNLRVLFGVRYNDEIESRILSVSMNGSGDVKSIATIYGNNNKVNGLIFSHPQYNNILLLSNGLLDHDGHKYSLIFYKDSNKYGKIIDTGSLNYYYKDEFPKVTAGSFTSLPSNKSITYFCSVYERGIKSLTGPSMDKLESISTGACEQIKITDKGQVYILEYSTNRVFYKSDISTGIASHFGNLEVFITDSSIREIDVSSTHLYYSNSKSSKLYQVSLSNSTSKRVILNQSPSSFQYFNGYIYYSIEGSKIEKISIEPNSVPITLFESTPTNPLAGHCVCQPGFTGINCDQCDQSKNIISWSNVGPKCIPKDTTTNKPITI